MNLYFSSTSYRMIYFYLCSIKSWQGSIKEYSRFNLINIKIILRIFDSIFLIKNYYFKTYYLVSNWSIYMYSANTYYFFNHSFIISLYSQHLEFPIYQDRNSNTQFFRMLIIIIIESLLYQYAWWMILTTYQLSLQSLYGLT